MVGLQDPFDDLLNRNLINSKILVKFSINFETKLTGNQTNFSGSIYRQTKLNEFQTNQLEKTKLTESKCLQDRLLSTNL